MVPTVTSEPVVLPSEAAREAEEFLERRGYRVG
jgi:hypothetical protein